MPRGSPSSLIPLPVLNFAGSNDSDGVHQIITDVQPSIFSLVVGLKYATEVRCIMLCVCTAQELVNLKRLTPQPKLCLFVWMYKYVKTINDRSTTRTIETDTNCFFQSTQQSLRCLVPYSAIIEYVKPLTLARVEQPVT